MAEVNITYESSYMSQVAKGMAKFIWISSATGDVGMRAK